MSKMAVTYIKGVKTLVVKQTEGQEFFVASQDNIVLPLDTLVTILQVALDNEFLDQRILAGLLEEYNTSRFSVEEK